MWSVNIYLKNKKSPESRAETEQRELSESNQLNLSMKLAEINQLNLSMKLAEIKRQNVLSKNIDIPKTLRELEDSLTRLENCQNETERAKIGREVDLKEREILLSLDFVIVYSDDFGCDKDYLNLLKREYNSARNLIQKANESFGKYSGWPFDFFSKCAKERFKRLEKIAKDFQPYLLGAA